MPARPQKLPDPPPPGSGNAAAPDPLSDVLQAVHLTGDTIAQHCGADDAVVRQPAGLLRMHIVQEGAVRLRHNGQRSTTLRSGDLVLLGREVAHTLRAEPAAFWVTGTFRVDYHAADDLLSGLPRIIVVPHRDDATWLPLSLTLLLAEMNEPRPGSQVMISRILDLLFIHTLRTWADSGEATSGWLAAVMDPALGPVLTAIHRNPGEAWTVEALARLAVLSRSAFATRFTSVVGVPPGAYVTNQRLDQAAHLLACTRESVTEVAAQVGYQSEAAFSRAFRRRHGQAPGRWRAAQDRGQ